MPEPLQSAFRPVSFEVELPRHIKGAFELATSELAEKAAADPSRCMGYFPDLKAADSTALGFDASAIDHDFPRCEALRQDWLAVLGAGRWLKHNFYRLALTDQPGSEETFHLDGDPAGRVQVDPDYAENTIVWRALGNLHPKLSRTLRYLDHQPTPADLRDQNRQFLGPEDYESGLVREVTLEPRGKDTVNFVVFPANRVWHTGGTGRHFVAGFGREEPADV